MWRLVLGLRSRDDELHGRRSAGNRRFGALDHIKLRRYLDWLTTSPLKNTQSLTSAARSLPPPPPCTLCTSQASWPRAARYASRGCRWAAAAPRLPEFMFRRLHLCLRTGWGRPHQTTNGLCLGLSHPCKRSASSLASPPVCFCHPASS